MSAPRVVAEDEGGFTLHDGASPFRVPKKGLSKPLEARIRSMATNLPAREPAPDGGSISFGEPVQRFEPVPLATPAPVSPVPLGMSPEERPVNPDPYSGTGGVSQTEAQRLSELRAGGNFDEASYQAALRGKFPVEGPQQDQSNRLRAAEIDTTNAARAAAQAAGIRLTGGAAQAAVPPAQLPPTPTKPPASGVARAAPVMPGQSSIAGGIEVQKGANVMAANAKAEEGRQTADALSGFQRQLEANALEDKVRVEEANARTADTMARFKAAQDEMNNISTTVDPGRYWASRSTGGKIAGIIGLALGALGAGPDGVNRAATLLNQAIDRDLDAQKSEHTLRLQKGQQAINAAQSAYAMEHQRFGDGAAASAAAKANLLSLAQNKLAQIAASSSSPAAAAQAQALNGALDVQKGQLEEKAAVDLANINQSNAAAAASRAAANAKGGPGVAESKELHTAEAATQNSLDLIARIRKGLKSTNSAVPGVTAIQQNVGAEAGALATDTTALILAMKEAAKLGVLSKADEGLLDRLIGDPQAVFTNEGTKQAKLDALEAMLMRGIANHRGAVGGGQAAPVPKGK